MAKTTFRHLKVIIMTHIKLIRLIKVFLKSTRTIITTIQPSCQDQAQQQVLILNAIHHLTTLPLNKSHLFTILPTMYIKTIHTEMIPLKAVTTYHNSIFMTIRDLFLIEKNFVTLYSFYCQIHLFYNIKMMKNKTCS